MKASRSLISGVVLSFGMIRTDGYSMMQPPTAKTETNSRRSFLAVVPTVMAASAAPALALDIDSFMQKELDNETCDDRTSKKCKPKLTEDEALCRFGQPSKRTGEACLRAKMSTKRPNGVDAFGSVDRGDFVKCKPNYVDDPERPGMLVNVWKCE